MVVLRMLKFDDNPIIFPPPDVLQLDATTASNASGNEVEALLTTQVKKYLKQASNAATNRQRLQVESDSEARLVNLLLKQTKSAANRTFQ
jgi:hypothetical protein